MGCVVQAFYLVGRRWELRGYGLSSYISFFACQSIGRGIRFLEGARDVGASLDGLP